MAIELQHLHPGHDDELSRLKSRIGTGKPEWGAENGKLYFVISWDKEIKQ